MPRQRKEDARRKVVTSRFNESEYRAVQLFAKSKGVPPTTLIHDIVIRAMESEGHPTTASEYDPNQLTID